MGFNEWCKQVSANLVGNLLGMLLGAALMGGMAYILGAPAWAYVLSAVVAAFVVLLFLSLRNGRKATHGKPSVRRNDETENDRWGNNRKAPLRIEFSDTDTYRWIGEERSYGLSVGREAIYRVAIRNTTSSEISGVEVWLTDIDPRPSELRGCGSVPLHITHLPSDIHMMTLGGGETRFIDVVSYIGRLWNPYIRIEHTSSAIKKEIYKGDDGYMIELSAKGNGVNLFRRRFKVGVNDKELYMHSLEQSEEDAMVESFEN